MAGEEYSSSRRGTPGEDYREVTREKMRFLRTLTVRRFSPLLL